MTDHGPDWLRSAAAAHPDAAAVITAERTVSYAELDRAADGVASIILASGIATEAVAFWGERTLDAIAACWGIPRAGVTAVPVDPRLPPGTAMDMTRAVGARGLWTTPSGGFDGLVDRSRAMDVEPAATPFVVFTSGSEGCPKAAIITGEMIEASVVSSRRRLDTTSDDVWLGVLPLFHVGGLSILWRQVEVAAPVLLLERFEPAGSAAALDQTDVASLVPVMLQRVLDLDERTWSRPRAVLIGGGPAPIGLLERARSRGLPVIPTYGMTETCSQIATPEPGTPLDGTVGAALDGAEVEIGEDGRIRVRGPMVSPGYVGEPLRDDPWFTTGDLGEIADGRLRVLGRADDVIVTGGENVYPSAVESVLLQHPEVADARVLGVSDPEWGQRVVAEIVTDVSASELDDWVRTRLTAAQRPREWRVVESMAHKLDG